VKMTQTESPAQLRALALAAGKQHRAGIRLLERHGAFDRGARRDLRKQLARLCRSAGVSRDDSEPAYRILDLISPGRGDSTAAERATEVRRVYLELRRSQVHPMILALASIAHDSISHAVKNLVATARRPRAGSVARGYSLTVVGEDISGFMLGYETGQKLGGTAHGIYLGISGAYHYSKCAVGERLPLF
jgi:hypothetical protein